MAEKKRMGRPPKAPEDKVVTTNFTMRMRPALHDELRRAAEASGHSITAEAERRLAQPDVHEVGRAVGKAVEAVERFAGKTWKNDEQVKSKSLAASQFALSILLGSSTSASLIKNALADRMNVLADIPVGRLDAKERAELELLIDAENIADSLFGNPIARLFDDDS